MVIWCTGTLLREERQGKFVSAYGDIDFFLFFLCKFNIINFLFVFFFVLIFFRLFGDVFYSFFILIPIISRFVFLPELIFELLRVLKNSRVIHDLKFNME